MYPALDFGADHEEVVPLTGLEPVTPSLRRQGKAFEKFRRISSLVPGINPSAGRTQTSSKAPRGRDSAVCFGKRFRKESAGNATSSGPTLMSAFHPKPTLEQAGRPIGMKPDG